MTACADRSGFLFAHDCDQPAAGACSVCGKPICVQHTRVAASGPTCITCLRDDTDGDGDRGSRDHGTSGTSSDAAPEAWAAGGGQSGGAGESGDWSPGTPAAREDDPYFFAGADRAAYYDAEDHAAFEPPTGGADDTEVESADADTDTGAS